MFDEEFKILILTRTLLDYTRSSHVLNEWAGKSTSVRRLLSSSADLLSTSTVVALESLPLESIHNARESARCMFESHTRSRAHVQALQTAFRAPKLRCSLTVA